MDFKSALSARSPGSEREWIFASTDDLADFSAREAELWSPLSSVNAPLGAAIVNAARAQGAFFNTLSHLAEAINSAAGEVSTVGQVDGLVTQLQQNLNQITAGAILTSESPAANLISPLISENLDSAATCVFLLSPSAIRQLGNVGASIPLAALLRSLVYVANARGIDEEAARLRSECQRVISNIDIKAEEVRLGIASWGSQWDGLIKSTEDAKKAWSADFASLRNDQEKDWKAQSEGFAEEWRGFRRQLEESVSLAEPTRYWKARAKGLTWAMACLAVAFVACVALTIFLFFSIGIPYFNNLHSTGAKDHLQIIIYVVPLLVPAFGAIWILRILGRLLARYARLSEDAREKGVMVQTFLALSREGADGEPLLKPDDRHLILKALFRPSDGTFDDDSPPFGLVDAFTKKIAS